MRLTVLGSGITTTIPGMPFRFPAAHLLEVDNEKVLLDAGIGVMPQIAQLGVRLTDINTICITHYHADHFAIEILLQAYYLQAKYGGQKIQLKILGPSDIENQVRAGMQTKGWTFDNDILQSVDITFVPYTDRQKIKLPGHVTLTPYRTKHFHLEAYALRLHHADGILTYSGDSAPSEALQEAIQGADVFLCEAAVPVGKPSDDGHINPEDAGRMAKKQHCKQLVLTHYSGQDSAEAMQKAAQDAGYTGIVKVTKDLDTYHIR
jgi:ribonuclease BN (tRNA processing enzyme)